MKTYLVTGAAGFIGAAVARKLISEGNQVVTIDNLSTGSISAIPEGCIFIKGDCFDKNVIQQLDNYIFDAILHIAGQSSGEISFDNPVYDLQTNTQSTIMLLDYAKKIDCKNFVYASTMSIYGEVQESFVDENTKTIPKSFYAVGKIASENYMRIFSSNFGIKCTALRLFNVFGIGQNLGNLRQGMASIFIAMAIKDRYILVKGAKDRFRDFVYIDDVVKAFIKALNRPGDKAFDYYNVATGHKYTVETVINTICKNLSYNINIEYTTGTPGDQYGIYGDYTKINRELGWNPTISFEDGMKIMCEWAEKELR